MHHVLNFRIIPPIVMVLRYLARLTRFPFSLSGLITQFSVLLFKSSLQMRPLLGSQLISWTNFYKKKFSRGLVILLLNLGGAEVGLAAKIAKLITTTSLRSTRYKPSFR